MRGGPPQEYRNIPDLYGLTIAARGGTTETKTCTDCHLSKHNDNNAIMAQLLMQGTNFVNFIGTYCWVAEGEEGFEAVEVTERDEPQAVIGSTLHEIAFPDDFREFVEKGRVLEHAHEHPGKDIIQQIFQPFRKPEILQVQARGEYLYAACGRIWSARVRHRLHRRKGFSERDHNRARFADRPAILRSHDVLHRGGRADHDRARSHAHSASREQRASHQWAVCAFLCARSRTRD